MAVGCRNVAERRGVRRMRLMWVGLMVHCVGSRRTRVRRAHMPRSMGSARVARGVRRGARTLRTRAILILSMRLSSALRTCARLILGMWRTGTMRTLRPCRARMRRIGSLPALMSGLMLPTTRDLLAPVGNLALATVWNLLAIMRTLCPLSARCRMLHPRRLRVPGLLRPRRLRACCPLRPRGTCRPGQCLLPRSARRLLSCTICRSSRRARGRARALLRSCTGCLWRVCPVVWSRRSRLIVFHVGHDAASPLAAPRPRAMLRMPLSLTRALRRLRAPATRSFCRHQCIVADSTRQMLTPTLTIV